MASRTMKKLSIIIPVYNEIETIDKILDKLKQLNLPNYEKEIVIVDDCSTDGTREFLQKLNNYKIFFHKKNLGKTATIRTAVSHITGDYTIIQDADLEYDPKDYNKLLEKAQLENASVIYGSRFMSHIRHRYRCLYFGNKMLSFLTTILFGVKITDMETCYKLFQTDLLKKIKIESEGFGFEAEVTAKLLKSGYNIYEVPINYKSRPYSEGKKIKAIDGIKAAMILLKYRFKKLDKL